MKKNKLFIFLAITVFIFLIINTESAFAICESNWDCAPCQQCIGGACFNACYGCESCIGGSCVDDDWNCSGCRSCSYGSCVDDQNKCSGCQSCSWGSCVDDNSNCDIWGCETCSFGSCVYGCTGCESCTSGFCADDDWNCTGCQKCEWASCVDKNDECGPCEYCIGGFCYSSIGYCGNCGVCNWDCYSLGSAACSGECHTCVGIYRYEGFLEKFLWQYWCANDNSKCTAPDVCFNGNCCTPGTCGSLGVDCGTNIDDGCGGTINCGGCGPCGICSSGTCSAGNCGTGCQTCQETSSNYYRCRDDSTQCSACQSCQSDVCTTGYGESDKELKIIKDGKVLAGIDSAGTMMIRGIRKYGSPPDGFKIKGGSTAANSVTIRPNWYGDSENWSVYPPGTSWNYQAVDDTGTSDGDSTFVQAGPNATDLYNMQTSAVLTGKTITNVKVKYRCKISQGEPGVAVLVKSGSSQILTFSETLGPGYILFSKTFSSKPGGGSWTKSDIDSLQVGIVASGPAAVPNGNGPPPINGRPPVIMSLVAGTKVLMADGKYKNIEDVQVEDLVTSFDVEAWEFKQARVSKKTTGSKPYLEINKALKVSLTHPVYVVGKGFIPASEIIIGDRLINEQGQEKVVETIIFVDEKVAVHDIALDSFQTFFADEYLVHNALAVSHKARCTQVYAVVNYTETITTISGIDSNGNLWLPGNLYQNSTPAPTGKKELLVKGAVGNLAKFDDSGNLYLRCALIQDGWRIPDYTYHELPNSAYGGSGSNDWDNFYNITSYSGYAKSRIDDEYHSDSLKAFDFEFDDYLTADARGITGIEVKIRHKSSDSWCIEDYIVKLLDGDGYSVGNDKSEWEGWSTSPETITYGGQGDTWGAGLTVDDIRSSNFGVRLRAYNDCDSRENAYVYWITIKIYYYR